MKKHGKFILLLSIGLAAVLLGLSSCVKREPLPHGPIPPEVYIEWTSDSGLVRYEVNDAGINGMSGVLTSGFAERYFVFAYELDEDRLIQLVFSNYSAVLGASEEEDIMRTLTEGTKSFVTVPGYKTNSVEFIVFDAADPSRAFTTGYKRNENSYFEITEVSEVVRNGERYLEVRFAFDAYGMDGNLLNEVHFKDAKGVLTFLLY